MPRNFFTAGCLHTLFDSGCTLVKSAFGTNGTVGASPSNLTVPWSGGVPVETGADSLPNYQLGRLLFTSGKFSGTQVSISTNDAGSLYLTYPLSAAPAPGDTFTAYVGCSKLSTTCTAKFNNLVHFRGFPRVPNVYVGL